MQPSCRRENKPEIRTPALTPQRSTAVLKICFILDFLIQIPRLCGELARPGRAERTCHEVHREGLAAADTSQFTSLWAGLVSQKHALFPGQKKRLRISPLPNYIELLVHEIAQNGNAPWKSIESK